MRAKKKKKRERVTKVNAMNLLQVIIREIYFSLEKAFVSFATARS